MKTIKQLRYSRGLTQRQLGQMIGVSGVIVSQWERRLTTPRISNAYRLSQLFGLPMEELDIGRIEPDQTRETGAVVDPQAPATNDRNQQSGEDSNGPDY